MSFDPILLARIQFAFTISFHILFPAFTIGLASFLAVIEGLWLATRKDHYYQIYKFWVKIFAVTFGMGVVSGVVMSYQFGTNWSIFSERVANVLGPLLGYEVLTAFFLEASFLGIMIFGWNKVSRRMHFASTCIVAVGTIISAFWILAANSWMQTPAGFTVGENDILFPTSWMEIIFNPSFPYRFFHMICAAYLTSAFVIGGVSAFYLWHERHLEHAKITLAMASLMALFLAPIQLLIGHEHGKNTMEHQPTKVAAMEANWDEHSHAPLYLFGWPDEKEEVTKYGITIPGGASWILTGDSYGTIPALKEVPPEDRPPVFIVFWAFRVMVGIGVLMIFTGIISLLQYLRGRLFTSKFLQTIWILMAPSGFIAILAGWFVTEVGRQPWSAYGVIRTAQAVTPAIIGEQVAFSLMAFIIMYIFVFGAGTYYIIKLILKGISDENDTDQFYQHSIEASLVERINKKEKSHV